MDSRIQLEADVLLAGFQIGYFMPDDIERWADRWIEATDQPCDELLDLSILRDTYPIDILNRLRAVGSSDGELIVEHQLGFIGLLYESGRLGLESSVRALYGLVIDEKTSLPLEMESCIYRLDDAYDLAMQGHYGSLEDVKNYTSKLLEPFGRRLKVEQASLLNLRQSLD